MAVVCKGRNGPLAAAYSAMLAASIAAGISTRLLFPSHSFRGAWHSTFETPALIGIGHHLPRPRQPLQEFVVKNHAQIFAKAPTPADRSPPLTP